MLPVAKMRTFSKMVKRRKGKKLTFYFRSELLKPGSNLTLRKIIFEREKKSPTKTNKQQQQQLQNNTVMHS